IQQGVADIVEDEAAIDAVRPVRALLGLILPLLLLTAHATGPESARLVLAEAVIDANRHSVGAGGSCRNKMKVPHCSGQVWLGNESKQLCSHWADRNLVVQKWCIGQRVHQLHWQGRKIATPLGQRRHVGKPVKWIAAARPRVVAKNEGLGST